MPEARPIPPRTVSDPLRDTTFRHQKIKFRRHEIVDLSALPSAHGQHRHWRGERRRRNVARILLGVTGLFGFVAVLAVAAVLVLLNSEWGAETMRRQAEQAVASMATGRAEASVGPSRLAFGDGSFGLELTDVGLKALGSGVSIAEAGRLFFGLRLLPLLTGRLQLGDASLSGARLNLAALQSDKPYDWTAGLRNQRGLIDPDLIAVAVFRALDQAFNAVERGIPDTVQLDDVDLVLPRGGESHMLRVETATLKRQGNGELGIVAQLSYGGRSIDVAGQAVRDAGTGLISSVDLSITSSAPDVDPAEDSLEATRIGAFSLKVTGHERPGGAGPLLKFAGSIDRSVFDLGARGSHSGSLKLDATLEAGSGKLEVDRLLLETGRSLFDLNGAVGPRPATGAPDDKPVYRFEFVSSRAVLAPENSSEQPLDFAAQLRGIFDPAEGKLTTQALEVRTSAGSVSGTAAVDLEEGLAPGIEMAVGLRDMPVSQVKQLWPWFSAVMARQWVYDHLFGGMVREANVEFKVAPGRLGNGVPLSKEEIVGRFVVEGTRFDMVPTMPPVREANGIVEVRGHEADITLQSGTVYLPSGRKVTGSNGTMLIGGGRTRPGTGKLSIDIAGDGAAVAELAAMEPINALRRLSFGAEDVSGTAKGHIDAEIPLVSGMDLSSLEWKVDLDFKGLGIDKPFDGQTLSSADGRLSIVPAEMTLNANGMLNGIPAKIDLAVPLRGDGKVRRDIELVLDDAARRKIAPGLDQILSGTARVQVEDRDGVRFISADLSDATVTFPWVGWSKGKGVSATAQFSYVPQGDTVKLSGFEFIGNSFSASGELTLSGGALASANLNRVRLNRGDDARVSIDRSGGGYRIDVSGNTLDVRSLVKTYLSATKQNDKSRTPKITLKASLDRIGGFYDESLSGVSLQSDGRSFTLSATTPAGRPLTASRELKEGRSSLNVEADDAGALLRFLDLYDKMQGGTLKLVLAGTSSERMTGQVDARDFLIVNEPRLASVVSTPPAGSDRSLSQAVRREIDTSRVQFERGYAQIEKAPGLLRVANGVVRGPLIGTTFQGTVYDPEGRIDMTGTFMPAYGLNRLFGELPLVGELLGNGRDRGLIGVTFKLDGLAKSPRLQVNPLSIVAPGIFRQIFEY